MPVYKDEKTNTWYCQFYYKDWDGKRKHTTKRGFERKRDAQKYESQIKLSKQTKKMTLGSLIKFFFENLNQRVQLETISESTVENYENMVTAFVKPFFNFDMMLDDVNEEIINKWLIFLTRDAKTRYNKPLKLGTVIAARTFLSSVFNFGVKKRYLDNNPFNGAEKLPTRPSSKQTVWTIEQYFCFYDSLKSEEQRLISNILFFGGLRIGVGFNTV